MPEQIDYFRKEHKYMEAVDTPFVNLIVNEFLRRSGISKKQRILELGSGYGRFSIPLLKRGYDITLSDISPDVLKKLKANVYSKGLKPKILQLDISKDKLKDKYDVVCGFHVLHHLPDVKRAFLTMNSMLKKNGKIIFVEPNPLNILYYIQILVIKEMSWKGERGILCMTDNYLKKVLKESRFNMSISRFGFFPNFIVNTKHGMFLEELFNKNLYNPLALYKLVIAKKNG